MASTATAPEATTVGTRVRALREAMDLSLRDLADRSGVSGADAVAGRAGRDEPDAGRGGQDRHRARAVPLTTAAASTKATE